MSEVRHDWLSDRWVIFAPSRSERPDEFEVFERASRLSGSELCKSQSKISLTCPFCFGQEKETPAPVLVLGEGATNGEGVRWRVRVVPNKFPAVIPVDHFGMELSEIEELSETQPMCPEAPQQFESVLYHRRPS